MKAVSCSADQSLKLWDLQSGSGLQVFKGHEWWVYCVCASWQDQQVLSGAGDKTLRLWDLRSGQCVQVFDGHRGDVLCVSACWSKSRAATGSSDRSVRVWDLRKGACVYVLRGSEPPARRDLSAGHAGAVWDLKADWAKSRLVTASGDRSLRMWDIESGRCLKTFLGHEDSEAEAVESIGGHLGQVNCVAVDFGT
eukprot:gnl/TRDRNA2_/TRDRNA2_44347_c0_seq1.p1 gnl/TRDRNA2_/TRDRNA2_44347_c0~~gnl/TRDRNA2_/TRDRNA2_44347_c0_seq1.p1  ORF type:complete len:211 (-),score=36.65 gnl/TRDRNA2_/TRDRNA2_44347_c0_seq1:102-686(-)